MIHRDSLTSVCDNCNGWGCHHFVMVMGIWVSIPCGVCKGAGIEVQTIQHPMPEFDLGGEG